MPYLIGQKKTRELLMTGDLIDAAEAHRIGLVNRVVPLDRLAAEVDALADRLARVPPDVMAPTKLMLNRAMEAAGFLEAVAAGLDLQSFVNMSETSREFDAVVRRDGLKAALAWRDQRYDERLAESGRRQVRAALIRSDRCRRARGPGRGAPRQQAATVGTRHFARFAQIAIDLGLSYWYTIPPHGETQRPGDRAST